MPTINAGSDLGPSGFIKIILVGFVGTVLYSKAIIPNIERLLDFKILSDLALNDKIIIWAIFGLVFGLLLSALDTHIYHFYEGIWPNKLWRLKRTEWDYTFGSDFNYIDRKLIELIYEIEDENKKSNLEVDLNKTHKLTEEILDLSGKIRDYPYDPEGKYNCFRRSESCTKLGNIIAEYETYSDKQYGMKMEIILPHIWIILPENVKKDIEIMSSIADFPIYISFILLTYSFLGSIGYYFQRGFLFAIITFIISLVASYILYKISIVFHRDYGKYIKAMFDLYRNDLGMKFNLTTTTYPTDEEIEEWMDYQLFILDYKKPKKEQ